MMIVLTRRRSPSVALLPIVLGGVLAAALVASPCYAQPPTSKPAPSSADPMVEAKQRFNEGIVLADQGNHEAARLKFNQAFTLLKSPAVVYNLARAEQLSGHPLEALEHFRLFQRMAPDAKISDAEKQRAADNIAELSKKVGQIDVEAPPGTRVSVNGRPVDNPGGDPIPVAPGKHVVEATIDGKVKSLTIEAQAGTMSKARFTDDASPAGANGPTNANNTGNNNSGQLPEHPPADGGGNRPALGYVVPIALGVVGVTGIMLGIGLRVAAGSKSDEAVDASRDPVARQGCLNVSSVQCDRVRSAAESERDLKNASTVSLVGGVAFSAAAVLAYVLWPKTHSVDVTPRQGRRAQVIPIVGPGASGLAFRTLW